MSQPHTKVSEYADELISVPRGHLSLELGQNESGLELRHDGRTVVQCALTREGMIAGGFMAEALGVKIPPLGQSVPVRVSTGVLYRALAISDLDFNKEESSILLERLLEEAAMQRGGSSEV